MPVNITDVSAFTSPITAPVDGDAATAASVVAAIQDLSNRTRYLYDLLASTRICKAWARINCQIAGSPILVSNFNIASVANSTDLGVSSILIDIDTNLGNADYAAVASLDYDPDVLTVHPINVSAGQLRLHARDAAGVLVPLGNSGAFVTVHIFGA